MAFEKFDRDAIGYVVNPTVSIIRGYWLRINKALGLKLRPRDSQFATFFYDTETNSVEIEFSIEKPSWYSSKVHPQLNCYNIRPQKFFKHYRVVPQKRIPATLREVDGKQRISFPVEVEVSDD